MDQFRTGSVRLVRYGRSRFRAGSCRLLVPCCGFRSAAATFKNPYYFYDLAGHQPTGNMVEVEQKAGHFMFDPLANSSKETMEERVSKVFGELGNREASKLAAESMSVTILGITVPARPEEPTNCCMSGCINCVWELYKDELGEWKQKVKQATAKLELPENLGRVWPRALGPEPAARRAARKAANIPDIVEAGSASEEPPEDQEINSSIEVFIETEKRLKAKRDALAAAKAAESARPKPATSDGTQGATA